MDHDNSQIPWTEEQWNKVQETVRSEAAKVRVAASFLPIFGPLGSEIDSVPTQAFNNNQANPLAAFGGPPARLAVNDLQTRPLTTISVNVHLRNSQMAQPDLSSALSMFRRAANIIGRIEDGLIFGGQNFVNPFPNLPQVFTLTGGAVWRGLIGTAIILGNYQAYPGIPGGYSPNDFVRDINRMISRLEGGGYLGPFALVLGNALFELAHTPTGALVMPTDRIKPILNGPLLRSSTIQPGEGILISLAGNPLDLVLASDISVKPVQITPEPRHVHRVSQRFTLRIKQPQALMAIGP